MVPMTVEDLALLLCGDGDSPKTVHSRQHIKAIRSACPATVDSVSALPSVTREESGALIGVQNESV